MMDRNQVLLTSESDGIQWNVSLWDDSNGSSLMTYRGGSTKNRTLTLVSQSSLIISAQSSKPILNVWKTHRTEQSPIKITTPGKVLALSCSPDGKFLLAGIEESLYLWQLSTGKLLLVLRKHYQDISVVTWTDDGSYFLSGGKDGAIIAWDSYEVFRNVIRRHPGAKEVTSDYEPEPFKLWNHATLEITDLVVGAGGVRSRIFSTSIDQACRIYDLSSGDLLLELSFSVPLTSVGIDKIETKVFVGSNQGSIHFFSLTAAPRDSTMSMVNKDGQNSFLGHDGAVRCLSISSDGSMLASGSDDCKVILWDIISRQSLRTLTHKSPLSEVRFLFPPLEGMLNGAHRTTFSKTMTADMKQLEKVVNSQPGENYILPVITKKDMEEEKEPEEVAESILSVTTDDTEVKKLKLINMKLYQSVIDRVLKTCS